MPALPVNARGRASRSNDSSRYDAFARGDFDDGWTLDDPDRNATGSDGMSR